MYIAKKKIIFRDKENTFWWLKLHLLGVENFKTLFSMTISKIIMLLLINN